MTGSSKAVFLGYASQDVAAARHIAAALRSAGIAEVRFDATARVPDKFREVQWTRLLSGETYPPSSGVCRACSRRSGMPCE